MPPRAGDSTTVSVARQREDPGSVLRFCRDLLLLRRVVQGGRMVRYQAKMKDQARRRHRAALRQAGFDAESILIDDPE